MRGPLNVKYMTHILAFRDCVVAFRALANSAIINRWIIKKDTTLLLRAD